MKQPVIPKKSHAMKPYAKKPHANKSHAMKPYAMKPYAKKPHAMKRKPPIIQKKAPVIPIKQPVIQRKPNVIPRKVFGEKEGLKTKIYKRLVLALSSLLGIYLLFLNIKKEDDIIIPKDTIDKVVMFRNADKNLQKCLAQLRELNTESKHAKILKHMIDKEGELLGFQVGGGGNYQEYNKDQADKDIKDKIIEKIRELKDCKNELANFEKNILLKIKQVYTRIQELKNKNK